MRGARAVQTVLGRPHRRLALRARSVRRVRSWTRVAKAASDAILGSGQTQVEMGAMSVKVQRSQHLGSRVKSVRAPTLSTQTDQHVSRVLRERNQSRRETGVMPVWMGHTRNLAHCVRCALRRMRSLRWMGRTWTARLRSNVTRRTHAQLALNARMRTTVPNVLQEKRGLGPCAMTALLGTARLRMKNKRRV